MLPHLRQLTLCLLLAAATLTACAGSATPRLIGAYPARDVVATYGPPPGSTLVTYDAYIDLRVADVHSAAAQADAVVKDYGGYFTQSQSRYDDDQLHLTLSYAVPVAAYATVHAALVGLGTLEAERVSGTLTIGGDGRAWNHFSTITLHLAPARPALRWPALPSFGWDPLATFRAAFAVFAGLFTALADILIWLTVVLGPFALLGLGLRALVRRWRPRP